MVVRGRICDSAGPRWWRVWTIAVGVVLMLTGPLVPFAGAELRAGVAFLGLAFALGGRLLFPRPGPRPTEIALAPGSISVKRAGVLSQRVEATHVKAASTARTAKGVAIALVRRDRNDRPILLELGSDEDLDRIREALRIGHAGFGALSWSSADRPSDTAWRALTLVATFGWLLAAAASAWVPSLLPILLFLLLPLTAAGLFMGALVRASRPKVVLTRVGVVVTRDGQTQEIGYRAIDDVFASHRWLMVRSGESVVEVPMRNALPEEIEHVVAQVRSAARRARGDQPTPPGLPATTAVLAPREEATRAWLERLDATAAALTEPVAYRAPEIQTRDLWTALESPDAPPSVRAGAARILARVAPEEARTRIAHVLEADHDERAKARIRIALEDDVEIAARRLDQLARR
jgi:hypothetical protein